MPGSTPQTTPQKKQSPVKLKAQARLQRQIDDGHVGAEAYVVPPRTVDIDIRLPDERSALSLWAKEFCATSLPAFLKQAGLAR